jgi:hypothetical protein
MTAFILSARIDLAQHRVLAAEEALRNAQLRTREALAALAVLQERAALSAVI